MYLYLMQRILIIILIYVPSIGCLYEDQVGKFDWTQRYIGEVKHVHFEHSSAQGAKHIIVSTQENVLASINVKSGELGWRIIFEKNQLGQIDDQLYLPNYLVTVVSGGRFVRAFNPSTGHMLWEKSLTNSQRSGGEVKVFGQDADKVAVLCESTIVILEIESGFEVWRQKLPNSDTTDYKHLEGIDGNLFVAGFSVSSEVTFVTITETKDNPVIDQKLLKAPWSRPPTQCIYVAAQYFICIDSNVSELYVLSLSDMTFTTTGLKAAGLNSVHASISRFQPYGDIDDSRMIYFQIHGRENKAVMAIKDRQAVLVHDYKSDCATQIAFQGEKIYLFTMKRKGQEEIQFQSMPVDAREDEPEMSVSLNFPAHHGLPQQIYGQIYKKRDGSSGFRTLILSEDHSIVMFQQSGRASWTREESLGEVIAVEMVDLPIPQLMAKMEEEFTANNDDIISMFKKRFISQFNQILGCVDYLKNKLRMPLHHHHHSMELPDVEVDGLQDGMDNIDETLTRDDFNLHKLIVAATRSGKIYGIDSQSGNVIWMYLIDNFRPFEQNNNEVILIHQQRTSAHYGLEPQSAIIGQHKTTKNGILFLINPITGKPAKGVTLKDSDLTYQIIQVTLMNPMNDQFLRPLLIMDSHHKVHIYPESNSEFVAEFASKIFLFSLDSSSGMMRGYSLKMTDNKLDSWHLWSLVIARNGETVTNVVTKRVIEHVHSQGIVLGDRSVMYKYLNPNLIAVTTEGVDTQDKAYFNVHLIDGVSGHVVFHCSHKKSKGPVHVVHAENWIVYNYWNQKHRRPELAVIELYEGQKQTNATVFSSLHPPPPPIAMRQAYIFPGVVAKMSATVTEKGITSKHILVALESGGILDLPKGLLDPRRPEKPTPESREEGLMPYVPELPRPSEAIINYNQSVYNVRGIYTTPAGLESTCLVVSFGLDLFVTSVTPSKMFDVLKEDFDYLFIGSVLFGIIGISLLSQKLAAKKALNRAWK